MASTQSNPPLAPLTAIGEACQGIDSRLGELDNKVVQLSMRLEGVLTMASPAAQAVNVAAKGSGSPMLSPHAVYLSSVCDGLDRINRNLQDLLDRLEF